MLLKIFSTLSFKKFTAGTTQPTGRQAKQAEPTATSNKKPPALGRALTALKTPLSKTRHRKYPPIIPPPLECFCTPYLTLRLADFPVTASTLPNSTLTVSNSSPLPPPLHSTIITPTTVHLECLPPIGDSAGKRDSKAEGRQLAIDRLVEALSDHQEPPALRLSEVDRLWDAEEAKALAKEEEEGAKQRAQRSDLRVKSDYMSSHDRIVQARLQAEGHLRRSSSNGRNYCEGPISLESPVTRQRLLAGRGVSGSYNEGFIGESDEDDDLYEGPFSLESPATRQRYLALSFRAWRPPTTLPK